MQIDALCVDMLRRCNAFQAKRFKRLKHLKLRPVETQNGRDMDNELTSANLPMFLQGISAMPQRLCIDGFNALDEVIESTGHLPSMLNLRVLNIPDTRLTLSQIPDLLRGLPAIEELGIGYAADLGPAFSQVSTTDLPQLISTRYSPLAPHLWKLNQRFDEDEISLETFAEYAVMMKIMCPSLTHIATTPDHVQRVYRDTVKDEMSKPYLQGHIRELSVLLRVIPKVGIRLV
ncbi:hypothetical protein LPJ56_007066 [Coemansia sp. RSA 2599]|nr:hypothetical protein LPJ75_007136 [Coemansia sp. RSA 2598]KAJ1803002.1 hypothetical protein LPJ56_007066 [Coemansia sp. RSA 2599]